ALPAGRGADTHRVAPTLDLIVQPRVAATASLAADRLLLAEAARTQQGVLRVFELEGEVLSLGRYHLAPPPVPGGAVQRWRRPPGSARAGGSGRAGHRRDAHTGRRDLHPSRAGRSARRGRAGRIPAAWL